MRTRGHLPWLAPRSATRGAAAIHSPHAASPPVPASASRPHLTYCTNIHPGESWTEVRENLVRYLVPVRERFAPGVPFGVGLRLSAESAQALGEPEALEELRAFLRAHDLYVFTINGFPYGPFHGRPVKEAVYLPDWLQPERLDLHRSPGRHPRGAPPRRRRGHDQHGSRCIRPASRR